MPIFDACPSYCRRMTIENTTIGDLEFIYGLFDSAIAYQSRRKFPVWRGYDKSVLVKECADKNQYKILIDGAIAIVFSVCYNDKIIWGEKENGDALYLHRIAVNPDFKGRKLFGEILNWATAHARTKGIRCIRMDTWAENPAMSDYYKSFGFVIVGHTTAPDSPELGFQYRKLPLTLLEFELKQ
jgi:GNAT superfamily N-acetyltransferase